MTFQALGFYIFLPLTWLLWSQTRRDKQWLTLLAASLWLYASFSHPELLVVLALCSVLAWGLAFPLSRAKAGARLPIMLSGAGLIVALLIAVRFRAAHAADSWLSSIGVSYFALQAIAYLAEIYFERGTPEPNLGLVALYLAFFPKLVQGPLEKPVAFIGRLKEGSEPDPAALREGLRLLAWGLFQKLVVADRAAVFVDHAFSHLKDQSGPEILLAGYFFAIQLFADFSGYTDMARGTARLFGFRLSVNFKAPFLASSTADFWRRWHISLSEWIRDYLFEPLQMGFRAMGNAGTALALFISFALIGLWHGTDAGYLCFGLLQAAFMAGSIFAKPWQKKLYKALDLERSLAQRIWRTLLTFHMVVFSLLLFRARSLEALAQLMQGLRSGWANVAAWHAALWQAQSPDDLAILAVAVLGLYAGYRVAARDAEPAAPWRWAGYVALSFALVFFGRFFAATGFIYARF